VAKLELFGTVRCPHTQDMRDWLEFRRCEFVEHDVEVDAEARRRMREISSGQRNVPLLVEDGRVVQVGWQGRSCILDAD
jgi:glutaredoxin